MTQDAARPYEHAARDADRLRDDPADLAEITAVNQELDEIAGLATLWRVSYHPMRIANLADFVAAESDFDTRWRLVVEFLKEYQGESSADRSRLLADPPASIGDERWDVLFAALAEHLAMREGHAAPEWAAARGLRRFWFPFNTPGARAQAIVHAPAAFRRRGVFIPDYEIEAA